MKRYYSSTKPYYNRKRFWPINKLGELLLGLKYRNKVTVNFAEILPEQEAVIIVSNQAGSFGPLSLHYNYKRKKRMWLNSGLIIQEEIPDYLKDIYHIDNDGFKGKMLRYTSFLIKPVVSSAFKSVEAIPVYRDTRIKTTLRKTNETLRSGIDIILFPESCIKHSEFKYVNQLQDGFVFSALYYYKETGRRVRFYPAYVSMDKRVISIGKHILYDPNNTLREERERISNYIERSIEEIAVNLIRN